MGWFSRLFGIGQSKEFNKEMAEAKADIKKAKARAKEESKAAKEEYRHLMSGAEVKKAKKLVHDAEENLWKSSQAEQKVIVDWNQLSEEKERKFMTEKIKSQDEKEIELAQQMQKSFKVMETDRLERASEPLIKLYRRMALGVKEAEKYAKIVDSEVWGQEDLIEEIKTRLARRQAIDEKLTEYYAMNDFELLADNQKSYKELTRLTEARKENIQRLIEIYKKIGQYSEMNSKLRTGLREMNMIMHSLKADSRLFADRIGDEIDKINERTRFQGEIAATVTRKTTKMTHELSDQARAIKKLQEAAGRQI